MSKERDLLRRCVVWLAVASDSGIVNKDEVGIPTPNADACFSLEREITALLDSPTEADGETKRDAARWRSMQIVMDCITAVERHQMDESQFFGAVVEAFGNAMRSGVSDQQTVHDIPKFLRRGDD